MRLHSLMTTGLTVCFITANVYGQELRPKAVALPVVVEKPDQPSQLVFPDGRVATLMMSKNAVEMITLPMEITENLCRPQAQLPKCHYEFVLRQETANYLWTTHSDPSRVGKRLEMINGSIEQGNYKTLEDLSLPITNYYRPLSPQLDLGLPPDRIVCDHFAWLPSNASTGVVKMKIWSGEMMFSNFETGVNENQTMFSYSSLDWQLGGQTLELKKVGRSNSAFLFPPLLATSAIIFEDGLDTCQINIGSDIAKISSIARSQKNEHLVLPAPSFVRVKGLASNLYNSIRFFIKENVYTPETFR